MSQHKATLYRYKAVVFFTLMAACIILHVGLGFAAEGKAEPKSELAQKAEPVPTKTEPVQKAEPLPAKAEPAPTKPVPKAKNYEFAVGTEIYYYGYEEPNMQQEGVFYGLDAEWRYYAGRFFFHADTAFGGGEVDYTSPISGSMDNIDDLIFEARGLSGYGFNSVKDTRVYLFTGIGYRYLNDDSAGRLTDRGYAGYERESNYLYSPLGIESSKKLGNGWSMGASAEYDLFWFGKQYSNISDAVAGYSDLSNDQKEGYGLRGSMKLMKDTGKVKIIFEPFIRFWYIDKSEESDLLYEGVLVGYGWEPENETIECGAKVKIGF